MKRKKRHTYAFHSSSKGIMLRLNDASCCCWLGHINRYISIDIKLIHVFFILLEIYIIVLENLLLRKRRRRRRRRVIRCLRKCNSAIFLLFWISFNELSHYFSGGLQEKLNFRVKTIDLLLSVITSTKFVHFPWLIGNERRPSNSYKWSSTSTKQMK